MINLIDRILNILQFIDKEHYQFATVIIDKQDNCRKQHINTKYLGEMYSISKYCKLITCTPCYNYKLFKLQKEIIAALKEIIKEPVIISLLRNFSHSKESRLIDWIERNQNKLNITLTDFKAIFSTLSPKNTKA